MSKNMESGHFFEFLKLILSWDVPGHLLLPLSRDKGTPGQEFFFPGQRDNGTSCPGLSRDVLLYVLSHGNPKLNINLW